MSDPSDISVGTEIDATYFMDDAVVVTLGLMWNDDLIIPGEFPWLVHIRIHFHTQNENGFPRSEEALSLQRLAAPLTEMWKRTDVRFVGRVSTKGTRTFYCYAKDGHKVVEFLRAAFRQFPDYQVDCDCSSDPEWRFHYEELAPLLDYNLEKGMLLGVLQTLQEQGDDLTEARAFDHTARFPTLMAAEQFAAWAAQRGFTLVSPPHQEGEQGFFVDLSKNEVPDWRLVNGTLYELVLASKRFGGTYSSNGCFAVMKQPPQE